MQLIENETCLEEFQVESDEPDKWKAQIKGLNGTDWEGANLGLKITFPEEYPTKPPALKFVKNIFHPNVDKGCVKLKNLKDNWHRALSMRQILADIKLMLAQPESESVVNKKAWKLFQHDKRAYKKKIRIYLPNTQQQQKEECTLMNS